jgi:hypothetical protein
MFHLIQLSADSVAVQCGNIPLEDDKRPKLLP